jgi:hypothetical protein
MIVEIMQGLCWVAGAMLAISIVVILIGKKNNED